MMETDPARQLEGHFHEVGEAHHQAYIETDGADPEQPLGAPGANWARYYAKFFIRLYA